MINMLLPKIKSLHWLIVCLVFFCTFFCYGQPPGGSDVYALEEDPCASSSVKVTYNSESNNVINIDCPQNSVVNITFTLDDRWGCSLGCSYEYKLYSNGNEISTGHIPSGSQTSIINVDPRLIIRHAQSRETVLKVEIYKICYGFASFNKTLVFKDNFSLQTVSSGQEYTKNVFIGFDEERICLVTPTVPRVCCKPGFKQTIKVKNVKLTEFGGEVKLTGEVEMKSGLGSLPFSSILKLSTTLFATWKVSKSFEQELIYEITGKDGKCVYMGISIEYNVYNVEYYLADCDQNPANDIKLEKKGLFYEFYSREPAPCILEPLAGCKPPKPVFNQGNNRSLEASCAGSLSIESFGEGVEADDMLVQWESATGQIYTSMSLVNVPYGTYKVTITNECCEASVFNIVLCPQEQKASSWIYNNSTGKWCADFNCGSPVLSRNACTIQKCVDPDRVEQFFENGKCRERHYFKGEELGIVENGDANRKVEYDNFFNKCIYSYYCDDPLNILEVVKSEPDEEVWTYDEFYNECNLSVMCDAQWFDEVKAEDPFIQWEWDDFADQCVSEYITCNGSEVEGEESDDPYNISDWNQYSVYNQQLCRRDIICIDGGTTFEDIGNFDYDIDGQDQNCNGLYYYYKLYCNNEFVIRICEDSDFVNGVKLVERNSPSCDILLINQSLKIRLDNQVVCNNNVVEINDILSHVILKKQIKSLENPIEISTVGFPDGIYLISIISEGKRISTKKITVF